MTDRTPWLGEEPQPPAPGWMQRLVAELDAQAARERSDEHETDDDPGDEWPSS